MTCEKGIWDSGWMAGIAEGRKEHKGLARVARQFVTHYLTDTGCSNCGGIPHSASCFVARFQRALGLTEPRS